MATKIEKKLAYLQETKDAIKSALIEKGQTVSNTDTFRSYAGKILEIQGGGATETDVIPEQEFTLTLNSRLGVYMASGFDLFSLKSGEEYYVVWGEETFTCTAVDGVFEGAPCVAIGNPYPVGGTNNNLPFVIGCVPNFDGHTLCLIVDLAEQTETKKVRVYQKASGGGGSSIYKMTYGDIDPATDGEGVLTISHGLGVVPDYIAIHRTFTPSADLLVQGTIFAVGGFRRAFYDKIQYPNSDEIEGTFHELFPSFFFAYSPGGYVVLGGTLGTGIDENGGNMAAYYGYIRNANAKTFQVGGSISSLKAPCTYRWYAMTGII